MPSLVERPWQEEDPRDRRWQLHTSIKDHFTDYDPLVRTLWCEEYGAILLGGTIAFDDEKTMSAGIVNFAPAHRERETYYAVYSWLEGCENLDESALDVVFRSDCFDVVSGVWRREEFADLVVAKTSFSAEATELFVEMYQNCYGNQSVESSLSVEAACVEYPDLKNYQEYGNQLLRFAAGKIPPLQTNQYDIE